MPWREVAWQGVPWRGDRVGSSVSRVKERAHLVNYHFAVQRTSLEISNSGVILVRWHRPPMCDVTALQ